MSVAAHGRNNTRSLDQVLGVDLSDPRLYSGDEPERVWAALRTSPGPVLTGGFRKHWAVTRYQQVVEVYRNSAAFSSETGMHLGEKETDDLAGAAAGGLSLLVTDDPAHGEMRKAMAEAFSPRSIERLRETTIEIARGLVGEALRAGSVEFVEAVAAPLPVIVICELLGVPDKDRELVKKLTQEAFSGSGHTTSRKQVAAHAKLFGYCDRLLATKRRDPGDDMATVLANATMYGEPMRREVAVMNCHDLISGGNETARHTSSSAAQTMITQSDPWAALHGGEFTVAAATEEVLRLEGPVNHVMRRALIDVEIAGTTIHEGDLVTLWLRSANRDAEIFTDPDRLNFARQPNKHLTFGLGSHYCIAALLARIEVGAIIQALTEMVGSIEPAGTPERLESNFFRGYKTLPLRLRAR